MKLIVREAAKWLLIPVASLIVFRWTLFPYTDFARANYPGAWQYAHLFAMSAATVALLVALGRRRRPWVAVAGIAGAVVVGVLYPLLVFGLR